MLTTTFLDLFACAHFVLANGAGSVMPMCTDTIVLRNDELIPARNEASQVQQPVRLYFDSMSGPDSLRYQEVPVRIEYIPGTNLLYVLPERKLRNAAPNGTAQRYELRFWCNYFRNDVDPASVSRLGFVTAVWFNATAEARHLETGAQLDDACVFPNKTQDPIRYVGTNSVVVGARTCTDTSVFDHWTCSHPHMLLSDDKEEFSAQSPCWPADTVVFTAWYRSMRNGTVTVANGEHGTVSVYDSFNKRTGGYGAYELRQDRTSNLLLTAIPDIGYQFQRWSCTHATYNNGTARVLSVQMPTDVLSVTFTPVFGQTTSAVEEQQTDLPPERTIHVYDQLGRVWWQGSVDSSLDAGTVAREHVQRPGIYYLTICTRDRISTQSICIAP